jgi:hypothetical protein
MHDRKHLVSAEVEKLLDAAKGSRHAARDLCLLPDISVSRSQLEFMRVSA